MAEPLPYSVSSLWLELTPTLQGYCEAFMTHFLSQEPRYQSPPLNQEIIIYIHFEGRETGSAVTSGLAELAFEPGPP